MDHQHFNTPEIISQDRYFCVDKQLGGLVKCQSFPLNNMQEGKNMSKEYIEQAVQTLSNQYHGDKVQHAMLDEVLRNAIYSLKNLDGIKKTLFYGKELPTNLPQTRDSNWGSSGVPDYFESRTLGETTIHGIIGIATEAGELLEALFNTVIRGETFDVTNMKEEIGDLFWYIAILGKFHNLDFAEIQQRNIAKLRARYPQKFTSYDAINRDLKAERAVLEANPVLDSKRYVWQCRIGSIAGVEVPPGGDAHMRQAIAEAYLKLIGQEAEANFSGWGEAFTQAEKDVIIGQELGAI